MYELKGFPEDYCCCPSFSASYGMVLVGCIFQTSEMVNAVPASKWSRYRYKCKNKT